MRASMRRFAVVCLLVSAIPAAAADTGTISGAVFDQNGQPLPDAVVSISGDALPVGRTVRTGATGIYRFEYLPPGSYVVETGPSGTGGGRRSALVEVGRDTQVDLVVGLVISDEVTVTVASPLVDTRSSELSFNVTRDALSALPLERSYRGLFQLIPGVGDNRSPVGPAAGGGRQDNTYLIDGANITNPTFGYLGSEVNELDIAEVNLKRAGITAEFGRTAGTVTNVVSRSGTNELSTVGRLDWLPEGLVSAYKLPASLETAGVRPGTFRDPLLATDAAAAVGVGGPVVTGRVFFYGSARYGRSTKWGRVNKVGTPLPDERRTGPELYGKVTATPSVRHQLTASYRHRPAHVDDAGLTSDNAPSLAVTRDNGSGVGTVEWAFFTSARSALDVRYLQMNEHNEDVPVVDLGYLPPFDPANLAAMGQYSDPAQANLSVGAAQYTNVQNYRRRELRGTFTRYLDLGSTSHAVKAGAGYEFGEEKLERTANGWGAIVQITDNDVPALRARYYTQQSPQLGQGRTYSLFVQDEVAVGPRLSVNLGVLLNRDEFSQRVAGSGGCPSTVTLTGGAAVYESRGDRCDFLRFGWLDEVQPRLGASYQLDPGRGDKAYANWGRYYNMDQKSAARSLAPSRIYQTQTIFDLAGAVLSSGPLASTTGKMIDPAIQPIYTDEILVGYATPLRGGYSLDVSWMSRGMHNFMEDVPSRLNGTAPDSGPFVAVNLPCAAYAACRGADAKRSYRAFTADFQRRFDGRWMTDVNYTWSRFEGNFDLDYSAPSTFSVVYNTSSFIQDGPGTNVEDPNRFGPLFEDRPHVFKLFAAYAATSRLTASSFLRVQSGTPWAARARDWEGAVLNFLEPSGSHRNPTWTNLDLMGSYRLPIRGRSNVVVEARLLNVFNNQTQLSTDAQQYLDLRRISTPPYFAPYEDPNPFFGTGNSFAPPRRLHLAAVVTF